MTRRTAYTMLCVLLGASVLLSACATKQPEKTIHTGIVLEPEATEKALPLTPEEIQALKSTGEIDRNLPTTAMADVTKQYIFYLHAGRKHMTASIARCGKSLPYARRVFSQRGLPKDLAYLAIVESGFRTDARSPVGAVGAWQFMQTTGSKFGLDKDTWTDDRLDIYEATEAAASYLGKLYQKFHDWPTAIAAYNAGEGKMSRAMQESGGHNFFEVRERNEIISEKNRLREETKQYVPRFLAVVKIMRNLKSLNFTELAEAEAGGVTRVVAEPGTDLKSFSQQLNINWGDFCLLNRHHQGAVSSATRQTYLYVPEEKAEMARNLLSTGHQGAYTGWQACRLDADCASWKSLEKRYHVSSEKLRAVNPGCTLKSGELIYLPAHAARAQAKAVPQRQQARADQSFAQAKVKCLHRLAAHETLYAVAQRYAVTSDQLMRFNGISNPATLPVGYTLKIPQTAQPAQRATAGANGQLGKKQVYVVQKDDTFWNIAKRLHVSVDDLRRWNAFDANKLREGTRLTVYAQADQ